MPHHPDSSSSPDPHLQGVLHRLEDLERRLARVEQSMPGPARAAYPAMPSRVTAPVAAEKAPSPAPRPSQVPGPPHAASTRPPTPKPERPAMSLEQLIGGKWFLVLGSLIVVAGVGFFLKLAYDQGWIGNLSPITRCMIAGAFGAALIGVGFVSERTLGRFAGVGFTAAGLGVLYTTAYGAYGMFELMGPAPAFWMLCAVAGLGLLLAVRGKSLLLAILSLAGAYLTPLILAGPDNPAWALPAYLLVLMIVGSLLAVRDRRYRPLATIVWWATIVLGGTWIAERGDETVWIGLGFAAAVWGLVHVAMLRLPETDPDRDRWLAAITSFSTSLWSFGAAWYLADSMGLDAMWLIPAAGVATGMLGGMALAGMLRAFIEKPRTVAEAMGVSLLCQAGAFLPLVIMVGVGTVWSQILVWAVLGLAAAAAGRWIRAGSLAWYGFALLLIGTLRVLGEATGPLSSGVPSTIGLVFSWWMGLMGITAVAWIAASWLAGETRKPASDHLLVLRMLGGVIGCVLLALMVLHRDATAEGVLLAYLALGLVGLIAAAVWRRGWINPAASGYLSLSTLVWAGAFVREGWYLNELGAPPMLHPGLLWSIPIIGLWSYAAYAMGRSEQEIWRRLRYLAWPAALGIMLTATTMEVARVAGTLAVDHTIQAGSVSVWWAVVAMGMLIVGFMRSVPWLRYTGIGLLMVTAAKVLTWDLSQLSPEVRVGSFIATGLMLLGVGAFYLRVAKNRVAVVAE